MILYKQLKFYNSSFSNIVKHCLHNIFICFNSRFIQKMHCCYIITLEWTKYHYLNTLMLCTLFKQLKYDLIEIDNMILIHVVNFKLDYFWSPFLFFFIKRYISNRKLTGTCENSVKDINGRSSILMNNPLSTVWQLED